MITTKPKHVKPEYNGLRSSDTKIEYLLFDYQELHRTEVLEIQVPTVVKDKYQWYLIKGLNNNLPSVVTMFDMGNIALSAILNIQERPHLLSCANGIGIAATYYNLDLKPKRLSFWTDFRSCVTFQETDDDLFGPLVERMDHPDSLTRRGGSSRLFIALFDFLVDLNYEVLDILNCKINDLEEKIFNLDNPTSKIRECLALKMKINAIYSAASPLHILLEKLLEEQVDENTFDSPTIHWAHDIITHIDNICSKLDQNKSNINSLIELSSTLSANKTNEILKFLTILSTIFLPIMFLASVWGMNLMMPEPKMEYGYIIAWAIFIILTLVQLIWFRRKRWI